MAIGSNGIEVGVVRWQAASREIEPEMGDYLEPTLRYQMEPAQLL